MCVFPSTTHTPQGGRIQKQDPKIEQIVWLTALPPWVVCSPEIPGKAALGVTPLHAHSCRWPQRKTFIYETMHHVSKASHSTVFLSPNGHHAMRGWFHWVHKSPGKTQLRGPPRSGVKAAAWLPAGFMAWHINLELLTPCPWPHSYFPEIFQLGKLFFTSALEHAVFNSLHSSPTNVRISEVLSAEKKRYKRITSFWLGNIHFPIRQTTTRCKLSLEMCFQ